MTMQNALQTTPIENVPTEGDAYCYTNRRSRVYDSPPSLGFPRFARGAQQFHPFLPPQTECTPKISHLVQLRL
jgi:hypothetical protein